jgi:hypothetical protein
MHFIEGAFYNFLNFQTENADYWQKSIFIYSKCVKCIRSWRICIQSLQNVPILLQTKFYAICVANKLNCMPISNAMIRV